MILFTDKCTSPSEGLFYCGNIFSKAVNSEAEAAIIGKICPNRFRLFYCKITYQGPFTFAGQPMHCFWKKIFLLQVDFRFQSMAPMINLFLKYLIIECLINSNTDNNGYSK